MQSTMIDIQRRRDLAAGATVSGPVRGLRSVIAFGSSPVLVGVVDAWRQLTAAPHDPPGERADDSERDHVAADHEAGVLHRQHRPGHQTTASARRAASASSSPWSSSMSSIAIERERCSTNQTYSSVKAITPTN